MASAVQDGTDSGLESYEFPERGVHLDLDSCSEQITSPAIPALHSQLPFQDHLTALQDLEATECTKAVYLLPSHPQPESFPSSTVEDLLEDGEISDNDIPSSIYSGPPTVTGDRDGPINTKRLHAESATGKCRKRKRKRKQCQTLPIIPPQSSLSKLPKPQFPANILSKPSSNSKSASQPSSLPDMALAPRHSLTGLVGDLYPSAVLGPPVSESPEVLVQKSTASPHLNPSESVLRSIFGEGSLQFLASIHSSVLPAQPDLLNQEHIKRDHTIEIYC
ncbi:hypothetical protein BASA81_013172 [Batrachochytrium salamandrivorans]|nr:hypothetical protein BASA81_013172 [Batrachochytrium salamandrivorans]